MPRRLLIGILAFGTIAGFGSGFAQIAHRMHDGGWGCRGYDHASSRFDEGRAQPVAAPTSAAAPAPVAAPAPAAAAPVPQLAPIVVLPSQLSAPAQQAPISINLTVNPGGQVQVTPTPGRQQ